MYSIIQTIVFQVFFLLIYDVFLKKETFFNWNRGYLLLTSILSLILPYIKIDSFKKVVHQDYVISLPEVVIGELHENADRLLLLNTNLIKTQISVLEIVFYLGIAIAFCVFLIKVVRVINLIFKNSKSYNGRLTLVEIKQSNSAFSFFNYIFLGDLITSKEKETILKHELVHVNHKHTIDLLFFEILRIVFWFNPLIYMYQKKIMMLHEFIADSKASKYQNKADYYQNLLSQVFETKNISFINPFFKQSLIKKRIVMLQKSKSKQVKLFKYALLVPMVLGMLVYTSSEAQENSSDNKVLENIEVPFSVIENVPVYPGCEYLETNKEKKKCMSENLGKFVSKNFDTEIATQKGLTGRQRIRVVFKINREGNVVGIKSRAPHPALEKEAIRVISSLPKMKPGVQRGKAVTVPYSLPIIFEVKKNDKNLEESNNTNASNELTGAPVSLTNKPLVLFRDCEGVTLEAQKKCVSSQTLSYINQNFDTKIASKLGLKGEQRVYVIFNVNEEGFITDVRSRAPHLELEKEAVRLINTIHKLKPAKVEGDAVSVKYSITYSFQVSN